MALRRYRDPVFQESGFLRKGEMRRYAGEVLNWLNIRPGEARLSENRQRFIKRDLNVKARAIRFIPLSTYFSEARVEDYGSSVAHLFNFEVF